MATIKYTDADGKVVEVPADAIDWDSLDISDYSGDLNIDRLPAKWKKDVQRLRRENATKRVEEKVAEDKPAADDSEIRNLKRELARERVMRKFDLNDDEAALLRGETPDELAESAEALSRVLGARKPVADPEDDAEGDKSKAGKTESDTAGPADGTPKPRLRGAGESSDTEGFDVGATVADIVAARGGF